MFMDFISVFILFAIMGAVLYALCILLDKIEIQTWRNERKKSMEKIEIERKLKKMSRCRRRIEAMRY